MIKYIFEFLFLCHLLGDFYFQTEKMAERKREEFKVVLWHSIVYAMCYAVLMYFVFPEIPIRYMFFPCVLHALIDSMKFWVCKKSGEGRRVFFIDQALHMIVIMGLAYCISMLGTGDLYRTELRWLFDYINIKETNLLCWITKLLFIHKPANIIIGKILSSYKVKDTTKDDDKNAGRLIGTLERILMVIFVSIEQFSAVGLVLTAKSIARYDKISSEKEFAEYYLLGTLLSVIIAITIAILF